jgi:hypothetical protein
MGDAADDALAYYMNRPFQSRRRKTFQSGSGDFHWRTSDGVVSMHSMTDTHLRRALNIAIQQDNTGKAQQLQEVLNGR